LKNIDFNFIKYMKKLLLALASFIITTAANADEVKFSFECETLGTKITGEKKSKVKETFSYSEKKMQGKSEKDSWKILDAKFFSDGKKYEAKLTSYDDNYALYSYATQEGKGFDKKVNSFLFFIDFKALTLDRVVVSFPQGGEERVRGSCKRAAI
jgi:hypothetical protein